MNTTGSVPTSSSRHVGAAAAATATAATCGTVIRNCNGCDAGHPGGHDDDGDAAGGGGGGGGGWR